MYGVIDIGSNTIRLSCYQVQEGKLQYIFHKKSMAGLAGYVGSDGRMGEEGIRRLSAVLRDLSEVTEKLPLTELYVFATASLRNIVNTDEVRQCAKEAAGFDIRVITGEEEARLDFLGATNRIRITDGLLADIGGGSTELVGFEKNEEDRPSVRAAVSVPIGSLNLYTRHVSGILPEKQEMRRMKETVREELSNLSLSVPDAGTLIGVGGTCRAVGKLYKARYGPEAGRSFERAGEQEAGRADDNTAGGMRTDTEAMETEKIRELVKWLRKEPEEGTKLLLRVVPDRIHTILPGLAVLSVILKKYRIGRVRISDWGVREGYLLNQLNR